MKPKIHIDVRNASATTAGIRYSLSFHPERSQYLCNHTVVTTLAISNEPPIIMIGITAAAKIAVKPRIEYQAAMALSVSATSKVNVGKLNIFLISISYLVSASPNPNK
jgi:hypothetical protein